ncbi:type IV secretion system protein [Novosphingobium sp.]|uniref:type IV secretion system protein n=1 Tax=Novosphingobium sp. TaxID=1874826 RepID=UPI003BA895A0
MPSACPAAPANVHLVHALLDATDCHVRELVHTGYEGLFQGGGAFAAVLTTLMTLYVALIGYQLMLGRGGLRVGDVTLSVVKLAAILSFATQWEAYQAIVVRVLFDGTAQIATAMLHLDVSAGSGGDIFDRLQRAFDILSIAPPPPPPPKAAGPFGALAPLTALQSLPLVGGGMKVLALKASAAMLLFFSLGILLATKVVLGVLLALGPIFIALLLFDVTRGLFEGWLRAALAFAFAPATTIFLLAVMLEILEPSLAAMVKERATGAVSSETAYGVVLLVMVFAAVSTGLLIASASVFRGFRLPDRKPAAPPPVPLSAPPQLTPAADRVITPAAQTSAAVAAMARREERLAPAYGSESTVRILGNLGGGGAAAANRDSGGPSRDQTRLGDGARRIAAGRTVSGAAARRPD